MTKLKIIISAVIILTMLYSCSNNSNLKSQSEFPKSGTLKAPRGSFNFFVVSDWGRNGFVNQKEVAAQMTKTAMKIEPKLIVSCGDNFQVNGVASVSDPLWLTSYENIYNHPSLMVDWFPILGNHDYCGNTQAEIDYSKISRRWRMESHYYTFVRKINDSVSARLIFLDTPPLVSEYYNKGGYPDISKQDTAKQMIWLKDVLRNSKEQWKIVFGHHPVFSASKKHGNTPDLIRKLKPLFEKYNVQYYFCGHDHDMQHLREKDGHVDYIVSGSGSENREASTNDMSLFSKSVPGFSIISLYSDSIRICFLDTAGTIVYKTHRMYREILHKN